MSCSRSRVGRTSSAAAAAVLQRGEGGGVGRQLAPHHRFHPAVALLEVGQQRAAGRAGEVRDEGGAAVVQRRGDVAGMAPLRRPTSRSAAPTVPGSPSTDTSSAGSSQNDRSPARSAAASAVGRHPGQRVLDVVPARAVEPAVQALGDQDVLVTGDSTGRASNRLQPKAATDTHRPCGVPSERNRRGR